MMRRTLIRSGTRVCEGRLGAGPGGSAGGGGCVCHDGGEVTEKLTLWFFDEVPGEAAPAEPWLAGELGIDTKARPA